MKRELDQRASAKGDWVEAECALCGGVDGRRVLTLRHPDAPDGVTEVVECSGCGLRRLTPRPSQQVIGRYYGGDYNAFVGRARGTVKQAVWNFLRDARAQPAGSRRGSLRPLLGPFADWLFDINVSLDYQTGRRVVEMGCGYGDLLIYLGSRGCEVQGVDFDSRAAEKAGEYGVPVHVGDLASMDLPAGSFDVGVMCHSLEHVPDPVAEVREFARILKPGGELHIAVPNGAAAGLALVGADWMHLSFPLHFWFFDATTLTDLLRRNGFGLVRPPRSTSRTYYFGRWLRHARSEGFSTATRELARQLRASVAATDGGDVLRVLATRASD